MTTSTLAILILVSTISYFIVSRLSLRGGSNAPTLRFISRLLAVFILGPVFILGLTAFYFYMRFAA